MNKNCCRILEPVDPESPTLAALGKYPLLLESIFPFLGSSERISLFSVSKWLRSYLSVVHGWSCSFVHDTGPFEEFISFLNTRVGPITARVTRQAYQLQLSKSTLASFLSTPKLTSVLLDQVRFPSNYFPLFITSSLRSFSLRNIRSLDGRPYILPMSDFSGIATHLYNLDLNNILLDGPLALKGVRLRTLRVQNCRLAYDNRFAILDPSFTATVLTPYLEELSLRHLIRISQNEAVVQQIPNCNFRFDCQATVTVDAFCYPALDDSVVFYLNTYEKTI